MTAIDDVFTRCREEGRAAFVPYLTGGDPDLKATEDLLKAAADGGADVIELGVPFSDPVADGPVIQRSHARALASDTSLAGILRLVARQRDRIGVPIVLFSYYNPIHARGVEVFAEQAATSGVDGLLCVDLPPDEAGDVVEVLHDKGLDTIFLLAPTSDRKRVQLVDRMSTGFVYYVSRTGVTGERDRLPPDLLREARRVKKRLSHPLAVGFGISNRRQVAQVAEVADAVVVGSALVQTIEARAEDPRLATALEDRVRDLAAGVGKRE